MEMAHGGMINIRSSSAEYLVKMTSLSIRLHLETCLVCHTGNSSKSLCCIRSYTLCNSSRHRQLCLCSLWGFSSVHLGLICKCDGTPCSDKYGILLSVVTVRQLNWKCGLMFGLRGIIGPVHPIRTMNIMVRERVSLASERTSFKMCFSIRSYRVL